jgi:glycosyltransferase involved in cell wall biosynthesis
MTDRPLLDQIQVIIPVLNEEGAIAAIIQTLQSYGFSKIRVVDNGSIDASAARAQAAGAEVIHEPRKGYGQACWRGLQHLPETCKWILFCDGDGSDDLRDLDKFLAAAEQADFILGNRRATAPGRVAMTLIQNFGNGLATQLIRLGWGYRYQDLGPLRLIRREALEQIDMGDRGFGWTVEMQARAVELDLKICEIPVGYRRRQGGRSKISGTLRGSIQAGSIILGTLGTLYLRKLSASMSERSRLKCSTLWTSPLGSAIVLLLGTILILPYGDFQKPGIVPHFWVGISIMSAGFVCSWSLKSISGAWFWSIALLTRFLLLPMVPSDDIWRYLWEGYIQNLGFSPYDLPPNAALLEPYRTSWWGLINHLDTSALYPPLTQLGFRVLAQISPSVVLFKVGFILADVGVCWLLSRRYGNLKTLLYAWNPLVIYSFAGGGHYDSWFILPLVAAWLTLDRGRWAWSAVLLGMSVAIKWMTLPFLPFLLCRVNGKNFVPLVCLFSLPLGLPALSFCHDGSCPLIPTGSTFVTRGRSAELIPYLVAQIWPISTQFNWIYSIPLGLAVLGLLWRCRRFVDFAEGYWFALLTLSPIIHAWYFTWCIPFAVSTQNLGVRLVSISTFIYFVLKHRQELGNPDWMLTPSERLWLWLPFVVGYLWTIAHSPKAAKEELQQAFNNNWESPHQRTNEANQ